MKYLNIIILSLILSLYSIATFGQQEGVITYERQTYWAKIQSRLSYLSQEEKDRAQLTWGKGSWKERYELSFNPTESMYIASENQGENSGYSWRKEKYHLYRNFENQTLYDVEETLSKVYIIDDSLKYPKWKVQNQIREIAGHVCMLATTEDTIKGQTIEAWFAQDIPASVGPERYCGLPGAILEIVINGGDVTITAIDIKLDTLKTPIVKAKGKGKIVSMEKFQAMLEEHIAISIKSQRNPYWSIRY